jgi:hypothetical protein
MQALRLCDEELRKHRILFAIVIIAVGVVLTHFGIDSAVTLLMGAAIGFFSREMFPSPEAEKDGAQGTG